MKLAFDFDCENDKFGCFADIGWLTAHSYGVYGPLCNGGTTVLFESSPIYPDPARYWETVDRLQINHLYIAPTSLRLLIRYGDKWVHKSKRDSLKCLGSGFKLFLIRYKIFNYPSSGLSSSWRTN